MMSRGENFSKGFTLTELMIVVVLISVIASFGIPSFAKMMRKAHERNAITGLIAIHSANESYEAKNGEYYQTAGFNLAQINTALSLEILPLNLTYAYVSTVADAYQATAAWASGVSFTVRVDERPISLDAGVPADTNPCCSAGACPTRPACP